MTTLQTPVDSEREDFGKLVYPGDWLRFRDAADFIAFWGDKHSLPETCAGLHDSHCKADLESCLDTLSCGSPLTHDFVYHRIRHIARCRGCQEAEWISDGYEVECGMPSSWLPGTATREERDCRVGAERAAKE